MKRRANRWREVAPTWLGRCMAVTRPFVSGRPGEWREGDFGLVLTVTQNYPPWGFPCVWFDIDPPRAGVVTRLRPCTPEEEAVARLGGHRL